MTTSCSRPSCLFSSEAALRALVENYVGLPFQRPGPARFGFDPEQFAPANDLIEDQIEEKQTALAENYGGLP
jgi:hypothetical protein